jgi:AcrR family transcriptional regulator
VLAAAEAVFAEAGLKAQVDEVARRAGVGVGTVCRHFPTKQALVEAVLAAMYDSLLGEARAALADDDAGRAFKSYVHSLADFQARHRALAESMASAIDIPTAAQATRTALRDAISELVVRAQAAGAIRDDIGAADVALLFSAIAHTTAHAGELQPALRDRYVTLVLDALRPEGATPLSGRPIDFADFDRVKKRQARVAASRREPR